MAQSTILSRPSRDLNQRCATLKRQFCWIIEIIYDEKDEEYE